MELLTKLARGHDPAIDKAKAKVAALNTFGALIKPYLARQRTAKRERTIDEIERYLTVHAALLQPLAVKGIDRATVAGPARRDRGSAGSGARNNLQELLDRDFSAGWSARAMSTSIRSSPPTRRLTCLAQPSERWRGTGDPDRA